MGKQYGCYEIFQIAQQVERNGAEVYKEAAQLTDDEELSRMFFQLAKWEKEHEKTFLEMQKLLCEKSTDRGSFNSKQYMSSNPQALANLASFAIKKDAASALAECKNISEILEQSIKIEKDTIVFFKGLKDYAPDLYTKDQIGLIIKEEKRHVSILEQSLRSR